MKQIKHIDNSIMNDLENWKTISNDRVAIVKKYLGNLTLLNINMMGVFSQSGTIIIADPLLDNGKKIAIHKIDKVCAIIKNVDNETLKRCFIVFDIENDKIEILNHSL